MKKGIEVIAFAKGLVGRPYVLGKSVPKNNADYAGAFDCAEFVAFVNYQVLGVLYGCDSNALQHVATADAYTGYFQRDAKALGKIISVDDAIRIPGAMLLRFPAPNATGHIVFSEGNGKTVEANCTKYGCIESHTEGRRFDIGILLPGVEYSQPNAGVNFTPPPVVYRLKTPNMIAPYIGKIQEALGLTADNIFGQKTNDAVVAFQKQHGLIVDGEVQPGGETSKTLGI